MIKKNKLEKKRLFKKNRSKKDINTYIIFFKYIKKR